jgi:hypothetical protein
MSMYEDIANVLFFDLGAFRAAVMVLKFKILLPTHPAAARATCSGGGAAQPEVFSAFFIHSPVSVRCPSHPLVPLRPFARHSLDF